MMNQIGLQVGKSPAAKKQSLLTFHYGFECVVYTRPGLSFRWAVSSPI